MTQKERQERSKKEIFSAALEEFGSHPYGEVTMDQICANHKISKGMMYHYYSNKDELFLLWTTYVFRELEAYLASRSDELFLPSQTPFQTIRLFFLFRQEYFKEHPLEKGVFESVILQPPKHLIQQIEMLHASLRLYNRQFIDRAVEQLSLRPGLSHQMVTRYLESISQVFQPLMDEYSSGCAPRDLDWMTQTSVEILNMALFGVCLPIDSSSL